MVHLHGLVDSLPQSSVVKPEDRQRWIEGVMRWHRARAEWHVRRLYGLGGSEIGPVVRHFLDRTESGFTNIQRVVEQKLLQRLPEYQTSHMRRGTELEPLARLAFMYKYRAEQDKAAIAAMARPHGREGYGWLLGNPDDIVTLNGKRWLPDYKVPSSYDEEVPFDYEAQLHHYDLGARFRGIKCDGGLLLVKLDLEPELAASLTEKMAKQGISHEDLDLMAQTIARANVPGLRVMAIMVEPRKQMHVDILDCGAECWNSLVLRGVVPQLGNAEKNVLLDHDIAQQVAQYQQQYLMAKAASSQLESISDAAAQGLKETLAGFDLKQVKLPLTMVKATEKVDLDKEAVIAEAIERGATPEELLDEKRAYSIPALVEEIKRLGGNAEDPGLFAPAGFSLDKAKAFLSANDIPLGPFEIPKISIGLSTKKADTQARDAVQKLFNEEFFGWVDRLNGAQSSQMREAAATADTDHETPLFAGEPKELDVFVDDGEAEHQGQDARKALSMRI